MSPLAGLTKKQLLFLFLIVTSVLWYTGMLIQSGNLVITFGQHIDRDHLTSLWNFKDVSDQQLYLYEHVLMNKWIANKTKRDHLRRELAKYRSQLNDSWAILLNQQNITKEESAKFVFDKNYRALSPELFHLLPKNNPLYHGKKYRSCAVVGNSGTILNSGCGKEIDEHEYVFRSNLPPLESFEKDAGVKVNFTTVNPSLIVNQYRRLKTPEHIDKFNERLARYSGVLWMDYRDFTYYLSMMITAVKNLKWKNLLIGCANPLHKQAVDDFWAERNFQKRLSSGFFVMTTAIQICDEIDVYGFWPFSERYRENKKSVPYHYFDNLTFSEPNYRHGMDREFSVLVQLHNLGVLRVNPGPCS